MECPHCGSTSYSRVNGISPEPRDGVVFRAHKCNDAQCKRTFLSAQLVVVNELEPVIRLDAVLKALMDESDARSVEVEVAEEPDDPASEEAFVDDELEAIIVEAEQIAREDYERALAMQQALDEERER